MELDVVQSTNTESVTGFADCVGMKRSFLPDV